MNNKRRALLAEAINCLNNARGIVDRVLSEEQDSLDNIPENLMDSERYIKMEDAISSLENAVDGIETAHEYVSEASR